MKLALPEFVGYIVMVVTIVSLFIFVYAYRIAEWLDAREDRKKAAAAEADSAAPPAAEPA